MPPLTATSPTRRLRHDDRHQWIKPDQRRENPQRRKAPLLSNNQIAATAIGDFLNEGKISAKHTSLTFVGDSFKNTGNINSYWPNHHSSRLNRDGSANTGEIYNLGNITGENINLQTNGTLAQSSSGRIEATNAITAHSYWLNQNGYMNAAGYHHRDHGVVNNYGNITAKNISITTYSDITNEGADQQHRRPDLKYQKIKARSTIIQPSARAAT